MMPGLGSRSRQLMVLGALLVVLGLVYAPRWRARSGGTRSVVSEAPAASTSGTVDAALSGAASAAPEGSARRSGAPERLATRAAQRERSSAATWRRDPFVLERQGAGSDELSCTGILWDAKRPVALINGRAVQPGEEVDGYQVVDISRDRVSLSNGTRTIQLHVTP